MQVLPLRIPSCALVSLGLFLRLPEEPRELDGEVFPIRNWHP
jgi:hypothetical protein